MIGLIMLMTELPIVVGLGAAPSLRAPEAIVPTGRYNLDGAPQIKG